MPIEVRELLAGDGAAWWQLRAESLERDPDAFGKSLDEHRQMTPADVEARFPDVAAGSFHLGAFEREQLIGMATFSREPGLLERHKGHIYGVYVTAEHRGQGVGRLLIATLLERANTDPSLEQVLLAVGSGQLAANRLYRSFGFETFGTEPNALKIGWRYVNENHMILRLRG